MRPATFRTGDLVAANVQVVDDQDFEANRKRDTEARKVADEKYFESLIKLCNAKFSVFKAHQKLRDEDLEVLKQAISILHNGAKPARRGNFQGHLSGAASLLMRQPQKRLVSFLASEADGVHSPLLLMLATWLLILWSR